ncbi:MAG: class I SAM-dependent methyltransferase [Anaerolineae bacterium]
MHLIDIVRRPEPPQPWAEGDKIPWDEPGFSRRMLREHLSQAHDAASRRAATIDRHVDWIDRVILGHQPSRILDLGCGPGLYTERLARLDHRCVGIDFSPASIGYAAEKAETHELACRYIQADIRHADYGGGYDLVMLIYGELNVFRPEEAALILGKACAALRAGGRLLLEVSTFDSVRRRGRSGLTWWTADRGLFSDSPHIVLKESAWDEPVAAATERYYVVGAEDGGVTRYAATTLAYTEAQYGELVRAAGFRNLAFFLSFGGEIGAAPEDFFVILADR